jgi:hypothetical protein
MLRKLRVLDARAVVDTILPTNFRNADLATPADQLDPHPAWRGSASALATVR